MNSMVLLTILSVVGAAALFVALAWFLVHIIAELEQIGGKQRKYGEPASYLSKIQLGVRAIETQTGRLAPEVTRLNEGLSAIRAGALAIDASLTGVIDAVSQQGQS